MATCLVRPAWRFALTFGLLQAAGCSSSLLSAPRPRTPPSSRAEDTDRQPPDLAAIPAGVRVCVDTDSTESGTQRSTSQVRGTVARSSAEGIVLVDAVTEAQHEFGAPVLGRVPLANRLFRNVGIGRTEHGDEEVWLPAEQVKGLEILDSPDPPE
jgi:hypothetical protein